MYSPNAKQFEIMDFIGGLNVTKQPTDINDNQTPDAKNILNNELMGINSRYGYAKYYSTAIGTLSVNGIFTYNTYASNDFIIAHGTSLLLDLTSGTTSLYSGLVSGTIRSFEMEGNIYFLDGSGYIYYDGTSAYQVTGYTPRYYIGKSPAGTSGTKIDELNYISSSFKEEFNGDGTSTAYYLTYGSLTTQTPTVLVDNATQTLSAATSGFVVDYSSGIVNFTTAPSTGTNNVEITAYKPVLDSTSITNCTFYATYGEGNNTNVFLSGNSSYPARVYWSDTLDPTYFPATSYADVGVTNDKMMGFLNYNGALQLWKYRSVHSFNGAGENNSILEVYNNNEGCIATDTLKIVNGLPTCLSQRGFIQLKYEIDGYKFNLISEDINGRIGVRDGILTETKTNREAAFAYDFDNKYWVYLNSNIYILQYDLIHQRNNKIVYPWVKWDTANDPKCFVDKDGYLYFGGSGNFYKFDQSVTNDDGTAINVYYYSKKFEVDNKYEWIKWFLYTYFNFALVYGNTNVTITIYIDDVEAAINDSSFIISFWNPNDFNPNDFNPNEGIENISHRASLHKKGRKFQFKVSSTALDNSFKLLSVKVDYNLDRRVR
uniref:Uncharacterized protein n=1 Tax=viral metagenome TaxID=1070528 RepID=A0A6M3XIB1_9ZZZZ